MQGTVTMPSAATDGLQAMNEDLRPRNTGLPNSPTESAIYEQVALKLLMTRVATLNVNGVNGRLPVLLKWLSETHYDIVCLQELKTSDERFPADAIRNGELDSPR